MSDHDSGSEPSLDGTMDNMALVDVEAVGRIRPGALAQGLKAARGDWESALAAGGGIEGFAARVLEQADEDKTPGRTPTNPNNL